MGRNPWPKRKSYAFCESDVNNFKSFIFLPYKRPGYLTAMFCVMAHEVFHCMYTIMESVGALDSEEAQAYLMQYLMNHFEDFANDVLDFGKVQREVQRLLKKKLTKRKNRRKV